MLKPFSFRWLAILSIALAAPGLLGAGANTWIGSRPSTAVLSSPALIASYLGDPDLVYSAQDSDVYRSINGGRTWSRVASFDYISGIFVHPTDATLFVGGSRSGSVTGLFKSFDGGVTWTQTLNDFIDHFAASAAHPSTIYASNSFVIWRSDDGGETWELKPPPTSENVQLSQRIAALIIDPADETTLEVAGYDYAYPDYNPLAPFFRKSPDGGATWTDHSAGLGGRDAGVSAIAIDPGHPSTIFVGMSVIPEAAVFRSENGGASWSPAQAGLPARIDIAGLVMDPHDPLTLYASTQSGIFRTRDAGASWLAFGQQLDGAQIWRLSFDTTGRFLRAGTRLGTFELEVGAGALDVAAGTGRSHILSWDADRLSVHTLEDSGEDSATPPAGPFGAWLATAIADGADGLSRVLWVNGDGRAALEIVGAAGSQAVFRFAGPAHHSAADVSMGADGNAHLLWTSAAGAMYLASVDADGNATLGPAYGPYGDWTAIALADSPDGSTWVLWRATDGRSSVSIHHDLAMELAFRFPASPDLAAEDITVGADGRPRVLLVGADDNADVATVDASGNLINVQNLSPGGRPRRIAAGPDGLTRLLFSDADGRANVLLLNPDNTLHAQGGSEPEPHAVIAGSWVGTFDTADFINCPPGTPASARFTQQGSTIDGVLQMTELGCGATQVVFHGAVDGNRLAGGVDRGSDHSRYHFEPGSTAEGILSETLELRLRNNRPGPYPSPGGTMHLRRLSQDPASIDGAWVGTFDSVDSFECQSGTPASATITQDDLTIDGVLFMTHEGCGATRVRLNGTVLSGKISATLKTGGPGFQFAPGSTATGFLSAGQLILKLIDNGPFGNSIPGGTMHLHRLVP